MSEESIKNLIWEPGQILLKNESILDATEKYLLNGVHTESKMYDNPITAKVFEKFPFADIY